MMKFTRIYTLMFLAGLLSFSSCEEEEEAGVANGKMISLEFPIEVSGMKQVGDETPDTRAAATDAEKAVNSLYVVQFNGNATTSKAVVKTAVSRDAGNKVTFAKLSAVNANCRVYMVANVNPNVTVNTTTLGDFEKSLAAFSPTQTIPAAGLPMCGYKDFNPTTVATAPGITLTAMVAKLVVTYNVSSSSLFKTGTSKITLKNAAAGTTYNPSAASAQGTLTVKNLALGTRYTFYVAENRAGTNATATTWRLRTLARVPANSKPLYFEITGRDSKNDSITIVSLIGDPNKPTEFNINRNTCYTLTATINNLSPMDERITVTPDMINLSASATANCYIVTAEGNYGFDGSKPGNNSTVSGITKPTNLTTAVQARVLWQTGAAVGKDNAVVKSVEYDQVNDIVKFTTGSATEGNAVIGIFASTADNAPCLWSWHIWRLPSAPGTKTFNKTSATTGGTVSVTMMDRNLGAYNNTTNDVKSIGLLYQWGRKDPFPGPAGFNTTEPSNIYGSLYAGGAVKTFNGAYTIPAVKSDATTGTINYAIQYPGAFLYAGPSNDWLQTKDNNLWGTPWQDGGTGSYNKNQGTKSIYDPCPPGYRVPPQDTWNLQTAAGSWSNGMTMDKLGNFWFPAAGWRWGNSDAGKLAGGGSYGGYWSSSPYDGTNAVGGGLNFYNGDVYPRYNYYRAYAYSVRCVSE